MNYVFKPITFEEVGIISEWKYSGFMDSIYMKPYFENYNQDKTLKGPGNCDGFVAYLDGELFGLFEYYSPESELEIGLAINPKFVGKHLAKGYTLAGIEFGVKQYNYKKQFVKLAVEEENVPAYKAYLSVGFKEIGKEKSEILMRYYI